MPKENRRCGQVEWGVQQDRRTGTNGRKGTTCFPLPKGRCAYSNPRRELSTKNGRTAAKKLRARPGCESLLNMVRHLSVLALVGSFNHILVQGLTKTGLTAEAASGSRASSGASAAGRPGSSECNVAGGPTLVSRDSDDGVSDDGVSDDDVSDDGGDNMSLPDLVASDSEDKPAMAIRNLSRCTSAVPRMPTWAPTPHRVSRYQMLRHRLRALEKLHQLPPHELYKL